MASVTDWPWHHWARHRPESVALTVDDVDWCWSTLAQRCDALAEDFVRQGVVPDDIVALRGKNSVPMLLSYLALLQCGARVLPLNPQLPDALMVALLPQINVRHLLNLAAVDDCPSSLQPPVLNALTYPERGVAPSQCLRQRWQATRLATLTLTSGSSGLPKAAAHTFSAHLASARGVMALMSFTAQDSWLLSLPLFHVSGQGIVWRWLTAGGRIVVRPSQPLEHALQGCTHASLVPTQLWRLLAQRARPAALKAVLLGGASIPLELTQQAEALGIRCWCGYGLTELASTVCAKRADGRSGVGLPLSEREICVRQGEILLRGASLAAGYWRNGQLNPLTDEDGWFHTRDSGLFEQDEWHVNGRLDNQFFSGGEGIQPENIEAVLLAHSGVLQACVVPVDDPEFGQRPVAVLELAADATLDVVRDWLAPQLAGFQRPVAYYAMPATLHSGGIKIARQQVKTWAQTVYRTAEN